MEPWSQEEIDAPIFWTPDTKPEVKSLIPSEAVLTKSICLTLDNQLVTAAPAVPNPTYIFVTATSTAV